jgi:surface polysaccharide O-acyltransferase-like enzyme
VTLHAPPVASPANASSSTVPGRISGLNAGRLLAALGTIWIHTEPLPQFESVSALGRFAVPFFCVVAGFFLVGALRSVIRRQQSFLDFVERRFFRYYTPFTVWTFIYVALRLTGERFGATRQPIEFGPEVILVGTMYHLWFLPFLALASTIMAPLILWTVRGRGREVPVAVVILLAGVALAMTDPLEISEPHLDLAYFAERCQVRTPAFLWGVALGLVVPGGIRPRLPRWSAVIAAVLFVGPLLVYWLVGRTSLGANIAGVALAVLCVSVAGRADRALAPLASMGLGIYLLHPLVVVVVGRVYSSLVPGLDLAGLGIWGHLAMFGPCAILSIAGVWVMSKTPLRRIITL